LFLSGCHFRAIFLLKADCQPGPETCVGGYPLRRVYVPISFFDLILGCVRLDAQLVVELRLLDHLESSRRRVNATARLVCCCGCFPERRTRATKKRDAGARAVRVLESQRPLYRREDNDNRGEQRRLFCERWTDVCCRVGQLACGQVTVRGHERSSGATSRLGRWAAVEVGTKVGCAGRLLEASMSESASSSRGLTRVTQGSIADLLSPRLRGIYVPWAPNYEDSAKARRLRVLNTILSVSVFRCWEPARITGSPTAMTTSSRGPLRSGSF